MRKIICAVMASVLVLVLTACSDTERTVLMNEALTITRRGADIRVIDSTENREYRFTLRRRRKQGGTISERKVLSTNTFSITGVGNQWRIAIPGQPDIYIRW